MLDRPGPARQWVGDRGHQQHRRHHQVLIDPDDLRPLELSGQHDCERSDEDVHDDRSLQTASQLTVLALDEKKIAEPLASASSIRGPGIRARTPGWLLLARRLRSLLNGNDVWRDENRADPGEARCAGGAFIRLNAHATCSTNNNDDR